VFWTKEGTKKQDLEHDFLHRGEHQKARSRARFFARWTTPKSTVMILCTKENAQNNVSPKYEEILFWTVAAFKTDSGDTPSVLAFQIQFCLLNVTLQVMPTSFIFALVLPTNSKPKSEV
jgi:hypothetical protein